MRSGDAVALRAAGRCDLLDIARKQGSTLLSEGARELRGSGLNLCEGLTPTLSTLCLGG